MRCTSIREVLSACTGALAGAALLLAPAEVEAGVLYSQLDAAAPSATPSVNVYFPVPGARAQAADDFTVPAGMTWTVEQVEAVGRYETHPLGPPAVNIYLYEDAGGVPSQKALWTHTTQGKEPQRSAGTFVVDTPRRELGPGRYWLSVTAMGMPLERGSWAWVNRRIQSGAPAAWRSSGWHDIACQIRCVPDPVGLPDQPCQRWQTRGAPCGEAKGDPDQLFRLLGFAVPWTG